MSAQYSQSSEKARRKVLFWPRRLRPTVTTIVIDTGSLIDLSHSSTRLYPFETSIEGLRQAIAHLSVSAPAHLRRYFETTSETINSTPAATYAGVVTGNAWHKGSHYVCYWVGTPESIVQRGDLTENERERLLAEARRLSIEGNTVYAVAKSELQSIKPTEITTIKPAALTIVGLVASELRLQPGVSRALAFCKQHDIRIIYASCDSEPSVTAVAHKVGLLTPKQLPFRFAAGVQLPDTEVYSSLNDSARRRLIARYDPATTLVSSDSLASIVKTITVD